MAKQRIRSEIEEKDTWDLTLIYKSDTEFYQTLENLKKELPKIKDYQGRILENSKTLLKFLELSDELERKLYKLYYYAHLKLDEDTTNVSSQKMDGVITNLVQEYSVMTSFVMPELMKGDYKKVLNYIKEEQGLKKYRFNLEDIYRYQSHALNDNEERIISQLSKSLENSGNVFESLTDADMTFPNIKVNGEEVELTESNYASFIRSKDRNIRKQAFDALLGTYGNFKNTFATIFQGNVDVLTSIAKIKKFNSSIEASLFHDNLDTKIYNKLIDTINKHLNVVYDYFALKKEVLDLDELHLYDIYTPMVSDYDKEFKFDEAKEIILKALSVLGDDYLNNIKKAFNERWIDIYNNKGKRGGAYSSGFYDTKPYLLLNYEGKYEDVTTLIHELGHSMHTYYSCTNNPYNLSSYNIFVAEVASTVNELLLVRYLINNTNKKSEKLFLINQLLELYKSTIYRQVMFAEFERDMHYDYENGEVLTNEYLSNKYYGLVKKYFGDRVFCDELIKNEWMRIPHFYYNFYVYKYAIGLSAATKIVDDILSGKNGSVDNYLNFLKTGGSDYPANELLVAGVDVFDENLYLEAINTFANYIEEFKRITRSR